MIQRPSTRDQRTENSANNAKFFKAGLVQELSPYATQKPSPWTIGRIKQIDDLQRDRADHFDLGVVKATVRPLCCNRSVNSKYQLVVDCAHAAFSAHLIVGQTLSQQFGGMSFSTLAITIGHKGRRLVAGIPATLLARQCTDYNPELGGSKTERGDEFFGVRTRMAMALQARTQVGGGGRITLVRSFQQRCGQRLRVIVGEVGKMALDPKRQLPHADLINPALPFRV